MSDEEAKAKQEIAKATGKGIDFADKAGNFLSRVFGQPIEDTVGVYWGDIMRARRIERAIDLSVQVQKKLEDSGAVDIRPITEKVGVPLIEAVSLEDDPDIREMWVSLLVSALNPDQNEIEKKYVSVLSEISGREAKLLRFLFEYKFTENPYPGHKKISQGIKQYRGFKINDLKEHANATEDNIRSFLRLGVLKSVFFENTRECDNTSVKHLNEHLHIYTDVEKTMFTDFGLDLMSRCTENDLVKKDEKCS